MRNGVKEFHLVAEPVTREIAPGMKAHLWGYNGQSPGPTIEAVEGDRVRIFVTNRLPERTSIHWHGQRLPNGNTLFCVYLGHGHIGEQPMVIEVTRDKKVVWEFADHANFKTVNQIQSLDVPGDVTKGEILR